MRARDYGYWLLTHPSNYSPMDKNKGLRHMGLYDGIFYNGREILFVSKSASNSLNVHLVGLPNGKPRMRIYMSLHATIKDAVEAWHKEAANETK